MCGIVGYYGPKNPKDVILNGLRALEYRGYDSAGVAILDEGQFKRIRAEGKLSNLDAKLNGEKFSGHLGIGHTRWATHGRPTERNAHPHFVNGVSIVHNGIIENYVKLREELVKGGSILESETDSELVAHLIERQLRQTPDLLEAVRRVLPRLEGAYAVLAVWEKQPDTMIAFKNGPPLILGVGPDAMYVASDVQAIVRDTRKVIYLEDNEVVYVKGSSYQIFGSNGKLLNKPVVEVDWSEEAASKGGFSHFMLKEIFEQPRAVAQAIQPHIDLQTGRVALDAALDSASAASVTKTLELLKGVERVFIVACGTSHYAGLVGEYFIERLAGVAVECDIASEFRYRHPAFPKNSLLISVSQSGETADTLAAVRLAKEKGVKVLSICNVRNSSIDREADAHVYMNAGVEVGVASTKAFTATLSLFGVIALALARAQGALAEENEKAYVKQLQAAPSQMETVLAYDRFFKEAAAHLKSHKGFLYLGRNIHYPIALEGALKLKELAYMHAEGYAAGEMKHGPLALIDQDMAVVVLCPRDELYDKTLSNLEEARARGGRIIAIGTGPDARLDELSESYLSLPETGFLAMPLLGVIPLQLLAFHVADSLGHDVDQPRNLAKSVTVE